MIPRLFPLPVTLLSLLVAGCAGPAMNQAECHYADWREVGYTDGAKGVLRTEFSRYREACAEHGVAPDYSAYADGHDDGTRVFCTEDSGYSKGQNGYTYSGVCPGDIAGEFLQGYRAGRELHDTSRDLRRLDASIAKRHRTLKTLNEKVAQKEQQVVSDQSTETQRAEALVEIKDIQQRIGELEAEILSAEKRQAVMSAEYDKIRAFYRDRYGY